MWIDGLEWIIEGEVFGLEEFVDVEVECVGGDEYVVYGVVGEFGVVGFLLVLFLLD